MCVKSSETTHVASVCREACKILGCIVYYCLNGVHKDDLMSKLRDNVKIHSPELQDIYNSKFLTKSRDEIHSTGYVVYSLETALYSFFKFNSFAECLLYCVHLGGDTDSTSCMTGMICGAYYGLKSIPTDWMETLQKRDLLDKIADELVQVNVV